MSHGFRMGLEATTKLLLLAIIISAQAQNAAGLGFEEFGPAKKHMGVSPDWPKGAIPLRKHASRVYWQEVNGNDHSYFDGGVAEINELLKLFSEMELERHIVVVRSGRPTATSFGGKKTSYSVEFHLPSGIYLFHARRNAKSGLFSTTPRLFINLDAKLLKSRDKIAFPENVELHAHGFQLDQLLAAAKEGNSQAIRLLAEDGYDTNDAQTVIKDALKSDNQYVKRAAEFSIGLLDLENEATSKLRKEVAEFVASHALRYQEPTPQDVLSAIKTADSSYATDGFMATGSLVDESGKLMNWTVMMGKNKLLIRQTAAADDAVGVIDHTIFASPEYMGSIQISQYWVDGKLIRSKPFKNREPVGNTYDLLIGRVLWPLGISFSRRIDRVEQVSARPDGQLDIVAFGDDNLGIRWELRVDPKADYLITQAKGFHARRDDRLAYHVDAMGVMRMNGRSVNHTSRWAEGPDAAPISIAVHSISSKPDIDQIFEYEDKFAEEDSATE